MARKLFAQIRQQWMGALALFLVLSGGVAYAGATITGQDVVDGSLATADYKNNDIRTGDVRAETLTGADVANQSGVDTCVSTVRIGQLCVRAENFHRQWPAAALHCANLDLRLPTIGEALELAQTHDIPDVGQSEHFWTDEITDETAGHAAIVHDAGGGFATATMTNPDLETVCVTTPTN